MPNCPTCNNRYATQRGVTQHQRMTPACRLGRRPDEEIPPNNLLYFTAARGGMDLQRGSGDDFSVISDHVIHRFQVPAEVLAVDENERPRADGRQQKVIDFVEGVVEANRPPPVVPEPHFVKKLFYRRPFILFNTAKHIVRLFCILFLYLCIHFCHNGQCTATINHYYSDTDRFDKLINNNQQ